MERLTTLPLLVAALAAVAGAQKCRDLIVPIEITALTSKFNLTIPKTNSDVSNFILDLTRPATSLEQEQRLEQANQTDSYNITATYCEPASGPGDIAQVLTHGLAFDRKYWDVQPLNGRSYSYVEQALARGYSTFAYDRLGTGDLQGGATAHNDPLNDIQALVEVAALGALTNLVRSGGLPGVAHKYAKVVHVSHSFGSSVTFGFAAPGGNISDGIALTGWSKSRDFSPYFLLSSGFVAAKSLPAFSHYADGYLAPGTPTNQQLVFFGPDQFDPSMIGRAIQLSKPVTVGELLTKGDPAAGNSSFLNPVLVITGNRDIPYCGGNCSAPGLSNPSLVAATRSAFPDSLGVFKSELIPGAGHGLNFELTAQDTYATILDFFDEHVKGQS